MRDFRRIHAVKGTWAASERLLVCVGPSPLSARLIRATRRLAMGLRAEVDRRSCGNAIAFDGVARRQGPSRTASATG